MYPEAVDVEKTIEFILDQQAKFFAGLNEMRQEMREQAAAQGKINMALGKAMLGLTDHIERLTAAQSATDEQLKRLAETQAATDERLRRLAETQGATDERLNALLAVVDGIVRKEPPKAN